MYDIIYVYCGCVRKEYKVKHNISIYKDLFSAISDGNEHWKIGIYVRLSRDDGNSVSLSIVNQIKKIARYLRKLENFIIYDIYIDDGLTGTDFDRNDYIRLQEDIDNQFVNCMIVKDLTRYSRNIADGIKELDSYVLEKKIRFISAGIPEIDTYLNPTAISSQEVYQALQSAEDVARITSIKVRDIKEIKREAGEKNGGFPPYGYLPNFDGEHWLYDPVAGEIKKNMYLWSLEGMSDRSIAKKLNELGIPNPTKYKRDVLKLNYKNPHAKNNSGLWCSTTVSRILSDQTNIGCSVQGKSSSFDHKRHKQIQKKKDEYVIVENCHEKTISNEVFEKVSEIRNQRTRITKATGKVHMFANLVYCSNCQRAMKKNNSKNQQYLVCRTYKDAGKEYCNAKRTINLAVLEKIVLVNIQHQIDHVCDLQAIVEQINQNSNINTKSLRLEKMIKSTKKEMEKTEHIFDSSYYDWKNDDITKEQYQRIRKETEQKLILLRENLQKQLEELRQYSCGITDRYSYFQQFTKYKNIDKLDRHILLELIHRIYVFEDKTIKIEFNFEDKYLQILEFIEQNKNQENQKMYTKK